MSCSPEFPIYNNPRVVLQSRPIRSHEITWLGKPVKKYLSKDVEKIAQMFVNLKPGAFLIYYNEDKASLKCAMKLNPILVQHFSILPKKILNIEPVDAYILEKPQDEDVFVCQVGYSQEEIQGYINRMSEIIKDKFSDWKPDEVKAGKSKSDKVDIERLSIQEAKDKLASRPPCSHILIYSSKKPHLEWIFKDAEDHLNIYLIFVEDNNQYSVTMKNGLRFRGKLTFILSRLYSLIENEVSKHLI